MAESGRRKGLPPKAGSLVGGYKMPKILIILKKIKVFLRFISPSRSYLQGQ